MTITSAIEYKILREGAQGWVTSGEYADNGDLITRCDTTSGYFKAAGAVEHTPLLKYGVNVAANTLPTNINSILDNAGYEAALCVENSNYRALIANGKLYLMTDGLNWTVNAAAQSHIDAMYAALSSTYGGIGSNGVHGIRMLYRKIAFDPKNPAVIGIVLQGYGLIYTVNGGTSWTKHADIPASTVAKNFGIAIAFDRSSTVTGGKTQRILVYSGLVGGGVYATTGGFAGAFAKIAGSPENVTCMKVSKLNGHVWVAGTGNDASAPGLGNAMRYDGTSWTTITGGLLYLTLHPTNASKVFVFGSGGYYGSIANATAGSPTIVYTTGYKIASPDIPVLAWTNESFMSSGDAMHHPTQERISMFEGIGVFDLVNPPTTAVAIDWVENCKGIENLVVQGMGVTPNSRVWKCSHDRPLQVRGYDEVDKYPATHGANRLASIQHANNVDYAIDDPEFLMSATAFGDNRAFTSANGGRTSPWTPTADNGLAAGQGMIAQGNKGNAVWCPTNRQPPIYTNDGGATWTLCDFGAAANAAIRNPANSLSIHFAYYIAKIVLVADKRNPGTYYLFISAAGDDPTSPAIGRWKSTNGGANWTKISGSYIIGSGYDYFNAKMKQALTHEGHFWYTCGPVGGGTSPYRLFYSFDGMQSFNQLTSAPTEICDFALGKNAAGAAYQIIYAYSEGNGMYICKDFNPANVGAETWQLITRFPYGMGDAINTIAADPNHAYRHYIGFSGAGAIYGDMVNRLPATVQLGS